MRISIYPDNGLAIVSLSGVEDNGYGVQAMPGVTGLGLPPMDPNFILRNTQGGKLQGTKALQREMDIPMVIVGRTEQEMRDYAALLGRAVLGKFDLQFDMTDGSTWRLTGCALVGQGDYSSGVNHVAGRHILEITISIRSENAGFTPLLATTWPIGNASAPFALAGVNYYPSFVVDGDLPVYPIYNISTNGANAITIYDAYMITRRLTIQCTAASSGSLDTSTGTWNMTSGAFTITGDSQMIPLKPALNGQIRFQASFNITSPATQPTVSYFPQRGILI